MFESRQGFVNPGYIAALVILLVALSLIVYGNYLGAHGVGFLYVGYVVLALSFAIGMIGGGVRNHYALGILPILLAIALILINVLNIGGLKAYGL